MAMWRSTALPDPLPVPPYTDAVLRAKETGNTTSARPKIIRETTQFFLALKLWWTAPDYERIAELVLHNFPALVSLVRYRSSVLWKLSNCHSIHLPVTFSFFLSTLSLSFFLFFYLALSLSLWFFFFFFPNGTTSPVYKQIFIFLFWILRNLVRLNVCLFFVLNFFVSFLLCCHFFKL